MNGLRECLRVAGAILMQIDREVITLFATRKTAESMLAAMRQVDCQLKVVLKSIENFERSLKNDTVKPDSNNRKRGNAVPS